MFHRKLGKVAPTSGGNISPSPCKTVGRPGEDDQLCWVYLAARLLREHQEFFFWSSVFVIQSCETVVEWRRNRHLSDKVPPKKIGNFNNDFLVQVVDVDEIGSDREFDGIVIAFKTHTRTGDKNGFGRGHVPTVPRSHKKAPSKGKAVKVFGRKKRCNLNAKIRIGLTIF